MGVCGPQAGGDDVGKRAVGRSDRIALATWAIGPCPKGRMKGAGVVHIQITLNHLASITCGSKQCCDIGSPPLNNLCAPEQEAPPVLLPLLLTASMLLPTGWPTPPADGPPTPPLLLHCHPYSHSLQFHSLHPLQS